MKKLKDKIGILVLKYIKMKGVSIYTWICVYVAAIIWMFFNFETWKLITLSVLIAMVLGTIFFFYYLHRAYSNKKKKTLLLAASYILVLDILFVTGLIVSPIFFISVLVMQYGGIYIIENLRAISLSFYDVTPSKKFFDLFCKFVFKVMLGLAVLAPYILMVIFICQINMCFLIKIAISVAFFAILPVLDMLEDVIIEDKNFVTMALLIFDK